MTLSVTEYHHSRRAAPAARLMAALDRRCHTARIARTATVFDEEKLKSAFLKALDRDGPWFIVAKVQEEEYLPVAPVEPEMTLYRFRQTFVG